VNTFQETPRFEGSVQDLHDLDRVRPLRLIGQSRAQVEAATGVPERRIKYLEERHGSAESGVPTRELSPHKCAAVRRDYAIGRYSKGDWRALAGAHCLTLSQAKAVMTRQPPARDFDGSDWGPRAAK
jgi:hypothetical protein